MVFITQKRCLRRHAGKSAVCPEARPPRPCCQVLSPLIYLYTLLSQQSARPAEYLCLEIEIPSPINSCWWLPMERVAHLATVVMAVLANLENDHRDLEISPSPAEACNGRSWEPVLCWAVSLKNRRGRKCKDLEPSYKT